MSITRLVAVLVVDTMHTSPPQRRTLQAGQPHSTQSRSRTRVNATTLWFSFRWKPRLIPSEPNMEFAASTAETPYRVRTQG